MVEMGVYLAAKTTGKHDRKMIMNNNDIIAKTLFQPHKVIMTLYYDPCNTLVPPLSPPL
jgi:hypothetical protein